MKKLIYTVILLCLSLTLFTSCESQRQEAQVILNSADSMMSTRPDSSFKMIENILDDHVLDREQLYRYVLMHAEATFKQGLPVRDEMLVMNSLQFFTDAHDDLMAAYSAYYSARVWMEWGRYDRSMTYLLQAQTFAESGSDDYLKGVIRATIGELNLRTNNPIRAQASLKDAAVFFEACHNYNNQAVVSNSLGVCYLDEREPDSALFVFRKGLNEANKHQEVLLKNRLSFIQNIGLAYLQKGNLVAAKANTLKVLGLSTDSLQLAELYLNLGNIYNSEVKLDSATYFLNKSLVMLPQYGSSLTRSAAYKYLAEVNNKEGHYTKSLMYANKYDSITVAMKENKPMRSLLMMQQKYNAQLEQNKATDLKIKYLWIGIIVLIILLLIGLVVFLRYKRRMKEKADMEEVQTKIDRLAAMAEKLKNEKPTLANNPYRRVITKHFDVVRKLANLNTRLSHADRQNGTKMLKRFNEITYGEEQLDWNSMYATLNDLNLGGLDRLHILFPNLSENEFRMCCMILGQFDNNDLAVVLNLTPGSTRVLKTSLKQKLGATKDINIEDFLNIIIFNDGIC